MDVSISIQGRHYKILFQKACVHVDLHVQVDEASVSRCHTIVACFPDITAYSRKASSEI
jgi:hypothetical protein